MSLIGLMCKRGDTFSLQVLIGRGLFLLLLTLSSPSALRFISSFKSFSKKFEKPLDKLF